jgi:hypothetical protein
MSLAAMKYITDMMRDIGVPFAFLQWNKDLPDRYWVGSIIEPESLTRDENGRQEATIILQGYAGKEDWMLLFQDKETIERHASKTAILPNGNGIAVSFESGEIVPVGDSDIVSMKINLEVQEWSVN